MEWHPKRREVCKHTYEDMLHSVTTDFKRYSTGVFIQIFPRERVWIKGPFCVRYILHLEDNTVNKIDKIPALVQLIFKRGTKRSRWGR